MTEHDQDFLTVDSFRKWVARFEETDYVRKQRIAITEMHQELFGKEGEHILSPIDYSAEIPEKLTKETYIQMYRQVLATIRYDFHQDLLKTKSKEGELTGNHF